MRKSEISWEHSLFTKLIVLFLLIIAPIFILGIVIFDLSYRKLSEEVLKSTKTQVSYYISSMDSSIQRIKKLQSDFISDTDLHQLSAVSESLTDYEKSRAILRVQQRLTAMQSSSEYIKLARVIIPSMNRAINASGTRRGAYTDINEEEYVPIFELGSNSGAQILQLDERLLLLVVYPFYYSKQDPMFAIEVELDKDVIHRELLKQYGDEGFQFSLDIPIYGAIISNITAEEFKTQSGSILESHMREKDSDAVSIKLDNERYLFIYEIADSTGLTLSVYLTEKKIFHPLDMLKFLYLVFLSLVVMFIIIYYMITYKLVRRPLLILVKSFQQVEQGDFLTKIEYSTKNEIGFLFEHFNRMVENLSVLIDQVYKQKILTQKAELRQLQSQINPHFLYNSYFLLHRIIKKEDYVNAVRFSKEMGTYFKYITRSASELVELSSEVEHARIYTEFQAMRFQGRISVDFGVLPESMQHMMVPKLILQPIIENSFEHGLENRTENASLIVLFKELNNGVRITVEDNGEDSDEKTLERINMNLLDEDPNKELTGILNINKRIRMMYNNGSGVSVTRSKLGGLAVSIVILAEEMGADICTDY